MQQAAAVGAPLTVIAVHEVPKSYWGGIPVVGPADAALLESLRRAAEEMKKGQPAGWAMPGRPR